MSTESQTLDDKVVQFGTNAARSKPRKKRGDTALGTFAFRTTDGWLTVLQNDDDGDPKWSPVCSPIKLLALSRDSSSKNWGKWIEVTRPRRARTSSCNFCRNARQLSQ